MEFVFRRLYRAPVQLVIFDWTGTTIDYGCYAPALAMIETFKQNGIDITMADARAAMGLNKRDHLQALTQTETVVEQWHALYERSIEEHDIDAMYAIFRSVLLESLADHATLIPGTLETVNTLLSQGIKIGTTTGYFPAALDIILAEAEAQGYTPDSNTCATRVPAGRPAPWMIYQTMMKTNTYPPAAVVKVGDTLPDVEAGLNAGVWTIFLAQTGNAIGLNQEDIAALAPEALQEKLDAAYQGMFHTGVHYVIDGIWDLPDIIENINHKLAEGERP